MIQYDTSVPSFLLPYLETSAMKRIDHVDMNCGMNYTSVPLFSGIAPYTRYTHSLGTALIIWHFTHDKIQTLSGLFHDIATPAFSHVIDFAHGDHMKQESTEDRTRKILQNSKEIMALLAHDHIELDQIYDYHQYPIADNDSPHLSSDRLEYTIGAAVDYRFTSEAEMQHLYDDLTASSNEEGEEEIVFKHADAAVQFADTALRNGHVFSSSEDRCCMQILAELINKAIKQNILNEDMLYRSEDEVIQIITSSALKKDWEHFTKLKSAAVFQHPQKGTFQVESKRRYIDPYCLETKCRVSQYDQGFKNAVSLFLNESYEGWMKGIETE